MTKTKIKSKTWYGCQWLNAASYLSHSVANVLATAEDKKAEIYGSSIDGALSYEAKLFLYW